MADQQPKFLDVQGNGWPNRRIAYLQVPNRGVNRAGVLWMTGFKSEMVSTKAEALAAWARESGRTFTRFDYSGHGQSEGRFEDGTIGLWLADSLEVFRRLTNGRQIVVGSSMGGYLALLMMREFQASPAQSGSERLAGLILIAPAWNMTERLMWSQMPSQAQRTIEEDGVWLRPSAYGDPYPITRGLTMEGRSHLLDLAQLKPRCPVIVLHGARDPDVPFAGSEELVNALGPRARLVAIPDGEHRLSRPEDIAVLVGAIEEMCADTERRA
jgi:pimeloyl-ACP methyl ester carboxylesterase